jgi:hypothetical protein
MTAPTREDYELAAKAAGFACDAEYTDSVWRYPFGSKVNPDGEPFNAVRWSPLYDDGDSRRLQVAIGCDTYTERDPQGKYWHACYYTEEVGGYREHIAYIQNHSDSAGALRHAVFWLAVEVGRSMK